MKKLTISFLALLLAMVMLLSGCNALTHLIPDGSVGSPEAAVSSEQQTGSTAKKTTAILSFTDKYGVQPFSSTGNYFIYQGNITQKDLENYADYLISCGYERNATLEKDYYAEDFDFALVLTGETKKKQVALTYTYASSGDFGIISYGNDCVFESGGGNGGNSGGNGGNSGGNNGGNNGGNSGGIVTPTYPIPPTPSTPRMQCPICGGTGKKICSYCNGSGYYDVLDRRCPLCHGNGTTMCTHCSGTGHL